MPLVALDLAARWRTAWPPARAALITLLMIIGVVEGCPMPILSKVPAGWQRDSFTFLQKAQREFLRPVRPALSHLKVNQRWKLFPVANEARRRLWIEAREPNSEWEIVYRVHDDDHAFIGDVLEYRRVRGAWNPGSSGPRGAFGPFVTWVAKKVFTAFPRYYEVRVRFEKIQIRPGGAGYVSKNEFEYVEYRSRLQVMK
jgi:hypothetical protein